MLWKTDPDIVANEFAEFLEAYEEAFKLSRKLVHLRGRGYDNITSILAYFPHGEQDITYEVYKKLTRIENCLVSEANSDHPCIDDPIEDSILDGINYLAFLYAYRKLTRNKNTVDTEG